ncbi:hypothetical protein RUM43_010775 [Polyplax serrata]|uniref:Uncharacterized protein n=1 Tax=Polyplax serrata TaxID=468196 RepID=A0AAN8PKZ1_POLSC
MRLCVYMHACGVTLVLIQNAREKLRVVREKQAEERQRRLEELKKHALEAQQLREQKELERKRRMEDLRQKENEKRSQVEERKRQIWEAEKERREAIVRKNQEREARLETKRRNERSSIVFAFGSSTPRLLETTDSNSFWGPRRATSTANLRLFPTTTPTVPLSRRPSERELEPKKRASSAGGLYRVPGDVMSTSMYEVFHWDSEPSKPRLSLAPTTSSYLSNIDDPLLSPQSVYPTNSYSHSIELVILGIKLLLLSVCLTSAFGKKTQAQCVLPDFFYNIDSHFAYRNTFVG